MKRRTASRRSSCSCVNGGLSMSAIEHHVTPAGVVEPHQVARAVLRARVEVGADLADQAIAEDEPLGAAVEAALAGLRVLPRHRPLDDGLLAVVDPVDHLPLAVEVLDAD